MASNDRIIGLYEFAAPVEVLLARQAKYVDRFKEHGARRVLDLGCGRGLFLEALRAAGIEACGIDLSVEAVEECRGKGLTALYHGDALQVTESLVAKGQQYDGIYCSHLIEHLPVPTAIALLRNAQRLLNEGGLLIIVTPNPASYHVIAEGFWLDPTHARPYPRALVERMLNNLGFAVERWADDPDTRPEAPRPFSPSRRGRLRRFLERWLLGELPPHLWHAFTCGQDQYFIAIKRPRRSAGVSSA